MKTQNSKTRRIITDSDRTPQNIKNQCLSFKGTVFEASFGYLSMYNRISSKRKDQHKGIVRVRPEAGAFGRLKKPQEALDAREWRWV